MMWCVEFRRVFFRSFPELVAAFNNSFAGLVQVSQNLAAGLAGSFGGGLSGFVQAGQVLLANLAGGFSLPTLAAQLSAALQASFGASFPELVAAFNGGLNRLIPTGQNLAARFAGTFRG